MSAREPSGIYLEVGGAPVKASDLVWLVFARCGCLSGAMTVDRGNGDVLLTAEAARASMIPSKVVRDRDIEDGFTYRLAKWDEYRALGGGCSHDPKWGLAVVDAPEGFVWATTDSWIGRRTHKQHIVPAAAPGEWREQYHALCGFPKGRRPESWSTRDNDMDDTVTCRHCEAKAKVSR